MLQTTYTRGLDAVLLLLLTIAFEGSLCEYHGKFIGDIQTKSNKFSGKVYAANDMQVYITAMNYDGLCPEAYFWVGRGSGGPDLSGKRIEDEEGSRDILKNYSNSRVLLELPKPITHYEYIGIFCVSKKESVGHVLIPAGFELPMEQKLGPLVGTDHGVNATEVTLKDSGTITLTRFSYDGQALGTRFAVGSRKDAPKDDLTKLLDESGREKGLISYVNRTTTLRLPRGHHWNEYGWFTIYSFRAAQSLGGIEISKDIAEKLPVRNPTSDVHKSEAETSPWTFLFAMFIFLSFTTCGCCAICCYCCLCTGDNIRGAGDVVVYGMAGAAIGNALGNNAS